MRPFDVVVARSCAERAIGKNGGIPWHLKEDMKWFRALTVDSVIIMGRRTWESLPVKPLPSRIHCILTREKDLEWPANVFAFESLEKALEYAKKEHSSHRCFVIGGEGVYREALASYWCQTVYETVVNVSVDGGDAFFPEVGSAYHLTETVEMDGCKRLIWRRKRPVVWHIDRSCYERDWLEECFSRVPSLRVDDAGMPIPFAILILNELRVHRSWIENYHRSQTPFTLVHLSDEYLDDDYSFYESPYCQGVYRHYIHPAFIHRPNIKHFGLGYRRDLGTREWISLDQRLYTWSFAGYICKSDRTQILELFKPMEPFYIYGTGGFERNIMEPSLYFDRMKHSKFVLCPVGNCSLDTFRLYEALEAGAIPVVLSSNVNQPFVRFIGHYWELLFGGVVPFVCSATWEENAQKMAHYLKHPDLLESLVCQCRSFWEAYKTRTKIMLEKDLWEKHLDPNDYY
jgi:dihydrofolate reductase